MLRPSNLDAGDRGSSLSQEFRFRRAIRVIRIDEASIAHATAQFDGIVAEI